MINIDKVLGYSINKDFIENLVNKNYEFIKKKIKALPIITHSFTKNNDTYIVISDKNDNYMSSNTENKFVIDEFISTGSYNKTYQISDNKNNKFVYRLKNTIIEDRDQVMENFLQTFIYGYLDEYQNKYLKDQYLIKIYYYGFNKTYKFCSTIVEKMDGTLYLIISNKNIPFENKMKIIIKSIYKIATILEKLQEDLYFVHNDLKCDNIFYKFINSKLSSDELYQINNLQFYLGDFDTSRIQVFKKVIMCKNSYFPDKNFNSKKDLFLLINSLFYSLNDYDWRRSFFKNFPIIENVANNQMNYYKLYNFKDENIDDIYLPKYFKKFLEKTYPDKI